MLILAILLLKVSSLSTSSSSGQIKVKLVNHGQKYYTAMLYVGTPGQPITVQLSLTSNFSWVQKESCAIYQCMDLTDTFKHSDSKTFKNSTLPVYYTVFFKKDQTTFLKGFRVVDALGFKGHESLAPTSFYWCTYTSFATYPMIKHVSGGLGLAINESNTTYSLLYSLKAAGKINQLVMGLFLNRLGKMSSDYNAYGSPASNIILGGYDLSYSSDPSSLFYIKANQVNGWSFTATGLKYGNQVVASGDYNVIIDSNTQLFAIDVNTFNKFYDSDLVGLSCSSTDSNGMVGLLQCTATTKTPVLQDIVIMIGEQSLVIPASKIWMRKDNTVYNSDTYLFLLMLTTSKSAQWILGNVVLTTYYTIFDVDNSTIGFAPAVTAHEWGCIIGLAISYLMI